MIDFSAEDFTECFYNIIECEHFLENYAKKFYEIAKYDYAFFDCNASCEYTVQEFKSFGYKKYAISLIPEQQRIEVFKQNWLLDGFHSRF